MFFDRRAKYGQNSFKSFSCPENFRCDLDGNNWDENYRTKRRVQVVKGKPEPWFLFLRFEKLMSSQREDDILKVLND